MRETIKQDLTLKLSLDYSDSIFNKKPLVLDATKKYIPRMGFNYRVNQILLYYEEDPVFEKSQTISQNIAAVYNSQKKLNLSSTETVSDVVANYVLTPAASVIMVNPLAFFDFLMRVGVLPNDPFIPKKSRKERMLKTIKDIYLIDD